MLISRPIECFQGNSSIEVYHSLHWNRTSTTLKKKILKNPIAAALKLSIPVHAVYLPFGFLFGFLLVQAGYPWYWAPIASTIIYGCSLQFPMLAIVISGGSPLAVALMAAAVSSRFLFYGPSLIGRIRGPWWERAYLAFGLVDATYSILVTHDEFTGKDDRKFIWTVTASTHISYVLGTLAGALLGANLGVEIPGLEFVLTALFVCLAVDQYQRIQDVRPFLIGGAALLFATFLTPSHLVLGGIAASLALLPLWREKQCA